MKLYMHLWERPEYDVYPKIDTSKCGRCGVEIEDTSELRMCSTCFDEYKQDENINDRVW